MLSGRTPFASTGDDTPEAILARIESGKVRPIDTNSKMFVNIVISVNPRVVSSGQHLNSTC